MLVYKCLFSGDEVCSDSYKQLPPFDDESLSDVGFEVLSKKIVKGNEDFGIADNSEEGEGGADPSAETVIDIVDTFRLVETGFGKKDFGVYIKTYMQRVKTHLEEKNPSRVEKFMSGAQTVVKKILASFDDFQFFLGESMDAEAACVFAYYKDGEETPRFVYLKDCLKEEKY